MTVSRDTWERGSGVERPSVTLKWAQTLDGRIATSNGHSRWITGKEARALAHRLRAEHDAVLVGIGTILSDNSQLTVRHCVGPDPLRIVVDSSLRTPLISAVLQQNPEQTVIATTTHAEGQRSEAIQRTGARVWRVPGSTARVDLQVLLAMLRQSGIRTVLVEGGAEIITSMLRLQLADRLAVFIAPKIAGHGIDAVGDLGIMSMEDALSCRDRTIEVIDGDILLRGTIVY